MGYGSGMPKVDYDDNNPYEGIYLSDEVMSNNVLSRQVHELLACSESLMGVLSPFKAGNDTLTIKVGNVSPGSVMETDYKEGKGCVITINSACVDQDHVFNAYSDYYDNTDYPHDGTAACTFSVSFTQEALHAKHFFLVL